MARMCMAQSAAKELKDTEGWMKEVDMWNEDGEESRRINLQLGRSSISSPHPGKLLSRSIERFISLQNAIMHLDQIYLFSQTVQNSKTEELPSGLYQGNTGTSYSTVQ